VKIVRDPFKVQLPENHGRRYRQYDGQLVGWQPCKRLRDGGLLAAKTKRRRCRQDVVDTTVESMLSAASHAIAAVTPAVTRWSLGGPDTADQSAKRPDLHLAPFPPHAPLPRLAGLHINSAATSFSWSIILSSFASRCSFSVEIDVVQASCIGLRR